MLGVLLATSNDASQRRLRKNWRRLYLLGIWKVWIVFAVSYFPSAGTAVIATAMSLVMIGSLAIRIWPQPRVLSAAA